MPNENPQSELIPEGITLDEIREELGRLGSSYRIQQRVAYDTYPDESGEEKEMLTKARHNKLTQIKNNILKICQFALNNFNPKEAIASMRGGLQDNFSHFLEELLVSAINKQKEFTRRGEETQGAGGNGESELLGRANINEEVITAIDEKAENAVTDNADLDNRQ